MNIIIPMAGEGNRFIQAGYTIPKPLITVNGKTLAEHSIESLGLPGRFIFITRSFDNPQHNEELTSIFKRLCNDFIEVRVDDKHLGAAHSSIYAEKYVDKDMPLIITNCDQRLSWNPWQFIDFIDAVDPDGAVVLHKSTNPKNSFALIENDLISAIEEKNPISDNALIGLHYWKNSDDFFRSAKQLVKELKHSGYPEAYVSVTYNYLINEDKNIYPYFIYNSEYYSLGTPKDIEEYLSEH